MDGLRWWLLFLGFLVVAGVYWFSRREQREKANPEPARRQAPTLSGDNVDAGIDDAPDLLATELSVNTAGEESESVMPSEQPQKIVTLRLVTQGGGSFPGDDLILSLRSLGMRHGKFGIFHRYDGDDENRTIFSAASLVEPGSFDLANIKDQEIPGISLFLVLPGPIEGVEAFDLMMAASRNLALSLNAELLDESGSTLSIQRERYMREEIVQYEHSNKVA